jgi:leukotriene-A4 hydrolase
VPYEKGALFLRHLEAVYGREKFDEFLKAYFAHFAFQSITTDTFSAYLQEHLLKGDVDKARRSRVEEWLNGSGIPADAPQPAAAALEKVAARAKAFATGKAKATDLPAKTWTAQEWMHFLSEMPPNLGRDKMAALDAAFGITKTGNSEVLFLWLMLSIRNGYEPANERLVGFLTEQGRRKFLKPIYEELVKTPAGKERALTIYKVARPTYHPLSVETVDAIVGWVEAK